MALEWKQDSYCSADCPPTTGSETHRSTGGHYRATASDQDGSGRPARKTRYVEVQTGEFAHVHAIFY